MLVENFNVGRNFWEANPQTIVIFSDIYNADNTKNKELSSVMMWAISFLVDSSSKWRNLSDIEKKKEIKLDFLDKNIVSLKSKYKTLNEDLLNWDSDIVKETIQKYNKYDKSKISKLLSDWEFKLEERNNFISSKEYNEETFEMLDKMLAASKKMWDEYLRIKKDALEEQQDSASKGGTEESDSEKGAI